MVCHDVVSLVIYYFHGQEVGLPTGGMPRCRELVIYYFHGREVGFTRRFTMDIWYGILLVFWVNCNYLNLLVIVFS